MENIEHGPRTLGADARTGEWERWAARAARRSQIRRSLTVALATFLICAASAAARPAVAATSVMVLYFDNDTGHAEYDSLAKGLADMMITDLSSVPSLQVVEREKLEALLKELKLQRKKYFDPKTAQRIGKGTGAAYAITGSFLSIEPNIRLDVRMVKIETAVVVTSASVTGSRDRFFDLQQQLTTKLVEGLSAVLAKGDAAKVATAAHANRVDDLGTLLTYSQGLDASDRGDLAGASKQLQKVVATSPDFKLGKDRYRQIMKALYDAKATRNEQLGASERTLLAHIDAELGKGHADSSPRTLAYRILFGQYHLTKVAQAIVDGRPAADYKDHLRAFVDNQLELFDGTKEVDRYPLGNDIGHFSQADEHAAEELGIRMPGNAFPFSYLPYQVLQQLGKTLIDNSPSIHMVSLPGSTVDCFYKLDPAYPKLVASMYERALAYLDQHGGQYRERDSMRVLEDYGRALAIVGRPEEGIAKLQGGLERYPKSDEFPDVEKELREILAGEFKARCK
jgi:TolB-like protein